MRDLSVPIDQAGRIVLPKEVRKELAIKPGDTFNVSVHGSSVILTANKETSGFVRKGKALIFTTAGKEPLTNEEVSRMLEEARQEREESSHDNGAFVLNDKKHQA